jgi:hypothetical protein
MLLLLLLLLEFAAGLHPEAAAADSCLLLQLPAADAAA